MELREKCEEIRRTLDDVFRKTHPVSYKYVRPTRECKAVEDAVREYLRERHMEFGPVKWFVESEERDFGKRAPILGDFNPETKEIRIRVDARHRMAETLLHEAQHASQAQRLGAAKMKEGSKPSDSYGIYDKLEAGANQFAAMHLANVQFKVRCRLQ
jgi:hypothetical protein